MFSKHVVRLKSYHKPSGGLEILPQARWARPSGHYEYFMHNAPQRGGREGEGGLLPPWTLDPGPWTLDLDPGPGPGPWTLDPGPWTWTLDPRPGPWTLDPEPGPWTLP